MTIDRVGLRLQSDSLDVERLVAIAGRPATRSTERDSPVSSRQPQGPTHQVSTVVFEQPGQWDSLGGYVEALGPVLDRVSRGATRGGDIQADLVVAISARAFGFIVTLDPTHVAALGAAKCGILVDCYLPDGVEESQSAD